MQTLEPEDMVIKALTLMNLSTADPEWHMHFIPEYKVNGQWGKLASEPFVFNIKRDNEYKPIQGDINTYKSEFQSAFIGNLKASGHRINWPENS